MRSGRRAALGIVAVVALVVGVGAFLVGRSDRAGSTLQVPVLGPARDVYNGDLGDPFVLPVTEHGKVTRFVTFGTGDWPARVPTALSTDLTSWTEGPDAMPDLPPWSPPDPKNSFSWAPAAVALDSGYLLYVSLPEASSGLQCIGAATSKNAEGPYVAAANGPLLCQHELGGSIDPALVTDGDGHRHMLWKNDGNARGVASSLWEQRLADDGLHVTGPVHQLLTAAAPWHGGVVEEPAMIKAKGGGYWLFYSGNQFDRPEYSTGVAYCPRIEGPCREAMAEPFLATAALAGQANQFAPGGLETFRDAHGALWAVFDTWNRPTRNGRFYCCRSLQMAPILSS